MDGRNAEESLRPKIKRYLEGLGYPSESILFEYPTPHFAKVDAVVKINSQVLIACEIKTKVNLQALSEIGYDPIARKLQKEAEELDVKNYFISDGTIYLWLKTGSTGRPEPIDPIPYNHFQIVNQGANFLYEKLIRIGEITRANPITGDFLYDLSIILYCRIQEEKRIDLTNKYSWQDWITEQIRRSDNSLNYSRVNDIYEKVQHILEAEQILKDPNTVFKFVDKIFEERRTEWGVPRWLADFMAKVLDIQSGQIVLDIFSRTGVLTAAANLNGADRTISVFNTDRDQFWIRIHQLITGKEADVRFEPSLLTAPIFTVVVNSYDRILIAPPFNLKIDSYNNYLYKTGVNDSTAILIEVALDSLYDGGRIVAIVPESFLSSGYFVKARKYLLAYAGIEAIISLPNNTFHPFSLVKTSLLVITKRKTSNTFLASIEGAYSSSSKSIDAIAQTQMLTNLRLYRDGGIVTPSELGFIVKLLDVESFQYSKYWLELNYKSTSAQGFTTVPLRELTHDIFRGSPITENKEERGDIPLSPASVRKMLIVKESLSYTTKNKIPKNSVHAELDDILINSIGNYRGSAALVSSETVGLPINRHLFLIKPNRNWVLPGYLSVILNSEIVLEQLLDRSSGIIPSLNLKSFDNIYIPLPSLAQQEKIFNEFSIIANQINESEKQLLLLNKKLSQKLNQLGKEATSL